MKASRRWFQYSLRSFLVVLTALAVWLGIVVNRVREQREAVKAIEALGGVVWYDWQVDHMPSGRWIDKTTEAKPGSPVWLRELVGDDYFHEVKAVACRPVEADIQKSIPYLKRLRGLEAVVVRSQNRDLSTSTQNELNSALAASLPKCEIIWRGR